MKSFIEAEIRAFQANELTLSKPFSLVANIKISLHSLFKIDLYHQLLSHNCLQPLFFCGAGCPLANLCVKVHQTRHQQLAWIYFAPADFAILNAGVTRP